MKLSIVVRLIFFPVFGGVASAQTTSYPGAIDTASTLFVVQDNVQTTLSAAMNTSDTAAVVASATGFVPNMIATICDTQTNTGKCTAWEHMLVTSVSGNVLTVTRAFAGTTARSHSSGRLVSALIDSAHQKVLKDAVIAIETALGPNLANAGKPPMMSAASYAFGPITSGAGVSVSGGNLITGNNTLTFATVPAGVSGTDSGHALYVSGGTGTAGTCTITGGSGQAGQANGQIIVNCTGPHSGAWSIQSSSGGLQEAVCGLPASGGEAWAPNSITLFANVSACGKSGVQIHKVAGAVMTGAFTILGSTAITANQETYVSGSSVQRSNLDANVPWATLNTIYDSSRWAINGYPINAQQGGNTAGFAEAVVGATEIPATSLTALQATGVAGYARTASAPTAAVGVFGAGAITRDNPSGGAGISAWGMNSIAQNCDNTPSCFGSNGFNGVNLYGAEFDVNVVPLPGGAAPGANVMGLYIIGGSRIQPGGIANAVNIAQLGTNDNIPWKYGIVLEDNSASTAALNIGVSSKANGAGSMPVVLRGRKTDGTATQGTIFTDMNGNVILVPNAGAGIAITTNALGGVLTTSDTGVTLGGTVSFTVPAIKATTGTPYVCVDTTGKLVKSATACSGS